MEVEGRGGETSEGREGRKTVEVPPEMGKKNRKVMVAVDDSDASLYALKWTLDNLFDNSAAVAGDATAEMEPDPEQGMVTVVHVMQPFHHYTYPAGPSVYANKALVESVRKAQEAGAAEIISRAFHICKQYKIKAETLILEGDPKEMICQAVEQMHVDLLVVGSRGLGMIKRALLGSISDFCAHHAKCPILIVKPPHK